MALNITHCTADTAVVSGGPGKIEYITVSPLTASPTAGLLTVYDNTAESGDILYKEWVFATAPGHTIELCGIYRKGIYVGFDGTLANVGVTVAWE